MPDFRCQIPDYLSKVYFVQVFDLNAIVSASHDARKSYLGVWIIFPDLKNRGYSIPFPFSLFPFHFSFVIHILDSPTE